jgi:hypothetical protein
LHFPGREAKTESRQSPHTDSEGCSSYFGAGTPAIGGVSVDFGLEHLRCVVKKKGRGRENEVFIHESVLKPRNIAQMKLRFRIIEEAEYIFWTLRRRAESRHVIMVCVKVFR